MSGAAALWRTPTPMRVFATIVFDPASSFLSATIALTASSVMNARSKGWPFDARARRPVEVSNSAAKVVPVCISQPGCTATSAAFTPFETSSRIGDRCADTVAGTLAATAATSAAAPSLALDEFTNRAEKIRAIYVPLFVCDHALGQTRPAWIRIRARIGNEGAHRAVARAADANPPPRPRIEAVAGLRQRQHAQIRPPVARFRVGHIERVVPIDEEPARPAELKPAVDELAVGVEDLHPVVLPVGDEQAAARVEGQRMRHVQLPRAHPFLAEAAEILAAPVEPDDARVADGRATADVPVGYVDVAVGGHGDVGRLVELAGAAAGDAGLAERHHQRAVRTELVDLMSLAGRLAAVGHPDVSGAIDADLVRARHHPAAEAPEQLAGGVELEDRIEWRVGASATACTGGAAAIDCPDGVIDAAGDAGRGAPRPAVRQPAPVHARAVRILQVVARTEVRHGW